jgi:hypothetical protein
VRNQQAQVRTRHFGLFQQRPQILAHRSILDAFGGPVGERGQSKKGKGWETVLWVK